MRCLCARVRPVVPDPMAQVLGASKHSSEGAAPGGGRSSDLGKWIERNGGAGSSQTTRL